jgi:hypothetical protein
MGLAAGRLMDVVRAYLSKAPRDHPDTGCPSAALLPEKSRQEPAAPRVYTQSVERLLNALEKALADMPKAPKAWEIAIGSFGLVIGNTGGFTDIVYSHFQPIQVLDTCIGVFTSVYETSN